MDVTCLSDLHGSYPQLEGGDLLIVAGDLTARHTVKEFGAFAEWLKAQDFKKKVFIAGNHDDKIQNGDFYFNWEWANYLQDSGTEFEGLKIWGSPWTRSFPGMNRRCAAFSCATDKELAKKWALIPAITDILITHSPPYLILDKVDEELYVGSPSLRQKMEEIQPRLHIFGHIHEGYGRLVFKHNGPSTLCVNASQMNEIYQPVNPPIKIKI